MNARTLQTSDDLRFEAAVEALAVDVQRQQLHHSLAREARLIARVQLLTAEISGLREQLAALQRAPAGDAPPRDPAPSDDLLRRAADKALQELNGANPNG